MIEFTIEYAMCVSRFMTLVQADRILGSGDDSCPPLRPPPLRAVVDQKSLGQIGLTR